MNIFLLRFCVLLLAVCASAAATETTSSTTARPEIRFGCGVTPLLPLVKTVETTYKQAFDALGFNFSMVYYETHKRVEAEAESERLDGECARVGFYGEEHPRTALVKVNVLLFKNPLIAWSHSNQIHIHSIDDIREKGLLLGYVRGVVAQEHIIKVNKLTHVVAANSYEQALRMLAAQRFDVLISPLDVVMYDLKNLNMQDQIFNVGRVGEVELFPFINKKHKHLIPELEKELNKRVPATGFIPSKTP